MFEAKSMHRCAAQRANLAQIAMKVAAGLVCAAALAPVPAAAQAVPDLAGPKDSAWFVTVDDFMPPPSGPGPVTNDKRYPYVDNVAARRAGVQPTYRVADLSNPILQPWAIEQMRKANDAVLAGKVPYRARERCHPAGVPAFVTYTLAEPWFFIQTGRQVTIVNQGGPEVRRIYLDLPHTANLKPSWYGESVGHYDGGDTLVVDTIGISTKSFVDNYRTPHTDKLHVVERYKLTDGGKGMDILVAIDDPGAFTMPWSAMQRFQRRPSGQLDEHICQENNPNFFNYDPAPKPSADKLDF